MSMETGTHHYRDAESEIDPATASLLQQIESQNTFLEKNRAVLYRLYPDTLLKLNDALKGEDASQRFRAFNMIAQQLMGEAKTRTAPPNAQQVLSSLGAFASIAARGARSPKISGVISEKIKAIQSEYAEWKHRHESNEMNIEHGLDDFFRASEPVDYGSQAVVFHLNLREQKNSFREAIVEENGSEVDDDTAVKVLKLYKDGTGKKEFDRHMQAYRMLEKARENNGQANTLAVPKPFLFQTVSMSEKSVHNLENYKCSLPQGKAEVLMMDFIKGKDYQHYILAEALALKGLDENFDRFDSHQLYDMAGEHFNFVKVLPSASETERWHARARNMSIVYSFLKSKSAKVSKSVIDQLKNGLEVMRKAGFVHGDLHERNLMFDGSRDEFFSRSTDGKGQSYMIDFGPLPAEQSEFVSQEQDRLVLNRLVELNK